MKLTLLSVIVPVYNVERYIKQSIDSVLAQNFDDFELILVDDGSTDNSGDICDFYAKKDMRIKVIHQKNSGVSNARNKGLEVAKGKWITFIDSDDWIDPDYFKDFDFDNNENYDLLVQGLKYIEDVTRKEKKRITFPNDKISVPDINQKFKNYNFLSFGVTVCKCYLRDVIDQFNIRFDELIDYHEDHLFFFNYLLKIKTIRTIDSCSYNYRSGHNPTSLSKKYHHWRKHYIAGEKLMESLYKIRSKYSINDKYFRKISTFCLSSKLNAVYNLYNEKLPNREKKRNMILILTPIQEIKSLYFPSSRRYMIIRLLAKDKSYMFIHFYFIFLSKLFR